VQVEPDGILAAAWKAAFGRVNNPPQVVNLPHIECAESRVEISFSKSAHS